MVLAALRAAGGPLDDGRLASRLGTSSQQMISEVCRRLQADGVLIRREGPDGKTVNVLRTDATSAGAPRPR